MKVNIICTIMHDATQVVRNVVVYHPKLLPSGGATEMAVAVAVALHKMGQTIRGVQQVLFLAVGDASMEVIPRTTLAQNWGIFVPDRRDIVGQTCGGTCRRRSKMPLWN